MRTFHLLTYAEISRAFQNTARYELGYFDHTVLLDGQRFERAIPATVNLYVSYGRPIDYLPNPLSLPIVSGRFLRLIEARAERDVDIQVIEAPLIAEGTGRPISNFYVLNLLKHINCMNIEASDVVMDEGVVDAVFQYVFDVSKIPEDLHIFRPREYPYSIVLSDELARDLEDKNLSGISFIQTMSMESTPPRAEPEHKNQEVDVHTNSTEPTISDPEPADKDTDTDSHTNHGETAIPHIEPADKDHNTQS